MFEATAGKALQNRFGLCCAQAHLSELLERAERRQDYQRADAIKRAYGFLDIGNGVELPLGVQWMNGCHFTRSGRISSWITFSKTVSLCLVYTLSTCPRVRLRWTGFIVTSRVPE